MFKSMLKKECVELAAPFLLAVGSLVILVGDHVSTARRRFQPHGEWLLDGDFVYPLMLISLALAIAIGLVQNLSEDVQGTWRYVLAMPGGWRRILKLKIACGLSVWIAWSLTVCVICLLGLTGDPGFEGEPLSRLADPSLRILACVPVVYLGAFLTGVRRANWLFSRLMPLGGVLMCWFLMLYLPNWWIIAPLVTAGFGALLVSLIYHMASARDFA